MVKARKPQPLTDRQRTMLSLIVNFYVATNEPCTVVYLTRRLKIGRTAVMNHLRALRDKGSLPPASAPRVTLN